MATVSMLIFIEECIYIYKKVPANKKSVIIWVNGAAPVRIALWKTVDCVYKYTLSSHGISLFLFSFSGNWHHVVSGDVDTQSHHVYWYDLCLVGLSFSASLFTHLPSLTVLCVFFFYPRSLAVKTNRWETWTSWPTESSIENSDAVVQCVWKIWLSFSLLILLLYPLLHVLHCAYFPHSLFPITSDSSYLSVATLPLWCSSSWSWCSRRWVETRFSWSEQGDINLGSARGRAAAAAPACHMWPSHGKHCSRQTVCGTTVTPWV